MSEDINSNRIEWNHLEVADHTLAMLAYWDRNLICRYANQAFLEWYGKTREVMVGIKMEDFLGSLFQKYVPYVIGVFEGKIQRFERDIVTPSGEKRKAIATFSPDYEDKEVKGFFVYISDISVPEIIQGQYMLNDSHNSTSTSENILDNIVNTLKTCLLTGFPGIAKLSRLHFISESKLKRDFKTQFNSSIFSYYRTLQMELAEKYLQDKKFSKKQLAGILNFSNPSNFSACYKKYLNTKKKA
ncbi:helix-turn-helix domain-containing protein [Mucilaginibacter aquaedulcis]|uniref:helix-turn-helix domain-containing protein n=1 Tax=Mucilaginibacter aquaedulcis TaxID=1187081 RepID=UPI0025B28962|nr:helix-turn-helix domain-containing protein [Mucilaginibacter aquaedulcis]MDN3549576.1 helix-turn-helix domain-containing protein [Mucilaginibacter aquaedulcis]